MCVVWGDQKSKLRLGSHGAVAMMGLMRTEVVGVDSQVLKLMSCAHAAAALPTADEVRH